MAITFTVIYKYFQLNDTVATTIKTWLDAAEITTVHGFVMEITGSFVHIIVAYA